jgi:hypothetical protein
MSELNNLLKPQLIELAEDILKIDLKSDDTKNEIIAKIDESQVENKNALIDEAIELIRSKPVKELLPDQKDFNIKAYDRFSFLTLDKLRRTKQVLGKGEQEELDKLKKVVLKQEGKTPLKSNTYKVASKLIRLVEGVPVPNAVYNSFSDYAKEKLFV